MGEERTAVLPNECTGNTCINTVSVDAATMKEVVEVLREWDEPGACGCDTFTCRDTCLPAKTRALLAKLEGK